MSVVLPAIKRWRPALRRPSTSTRSGHGDRPILILRWQSAWLFSAYFSPEKRRIFKNLTEIETGNFPTQESLAGFLVPEVAGRRSRDERIKLGSDDVAPLLLLIFNPGFNCILSMYLSMISAHFTRPVSLAHSAAQKPRPKSRNTGDAPSIDKSIKVNSDSIWLIYRLVGADECSGHGLVRQPSSAPSEIQFFKIYWLISNYKIHWIRLQSGQSCCGCRWSDWGTRSASWRYRRDLSIAIDTWFIIIEINSSFF